MMKIFFLIPCMADGGAEKVISILANEFVKAKNEVSIIMVSGDTQLHKLEKEISVIQTGGRTEGNPLKMLGRIRRLRKLFRENPDAVLVSFEPRVSFYTALASVGLSNKFFASERNNPGSFPHPKFRDYAYKKAKGIVFQSEEARNWFSKEIQEKGVVIENPISDNLPEPYTGIRKKSVVTAGRLEPQKNQKLLMDAFEIFSKEYPDYTLEIYGKGRLEEELKAYSEELGLTGVTFKGYVHDVPKQMLDAGMFVLSSDFEGMPNALMEAMSIGLPCISTDCPCGGPASMIQNGENGMITPLGDKEALAKAMLRMAADLDKSKEMGREAAKIKNRFTKEAIVEKWKDLLLS